MTRIAADKVVELEYTLRLSDGEVVDASEGEPLPYLHGHGEIVPGLEKALEGKAVGDQLKVEVSPEEGYGAYEEDATEELPRSAFPEDAELEEGDEVVLVSDDGEEILAYVVEVGEETVTVDFNHPLAGQALSFEVQVVSVRDATPEEIEHGHVHDGDEHEHDDDEG